MFTNIEFLDKYEAVDNFSTTLRSNVDVSDTTIDLISIDNLPDSGWVTIAGEEIIYYDSLTTGDYPGLSGCERPAGAQSWASGVIVEQRYNAELINNLIGTLRL